MIVSLCFTIDRDNQLSSDSNRPLYKANKKPRLVALSQVVIKYNNNLKNQLKEKKVELSTLMQIQAFFYIE